MWRRIAFDVLSLAPINRFIRLLRNPLRLALGNRVKQLPFVGTLTVAIDDLTKFRLRSSGRDMIVNDIFWGGVESFEPETLRFVSRLAQRWTCFFDVGAHTGIYSVLVGSANRACVVHAFEPVKRIHEALEQNIAENALPNVHAHRMAISDTTGHVELQVVDTHRFSTESSLKRGFRLNVQTQLVPSTTLEDFCDRTGTTGIDAIKIDVEGFEFEILSQSESLIRRLRPMIICEILYKIVNPELRTLIQRLDYKAFHIRNEGLFLDNALLGDKDYKILNYLFIPEEKLEIINYEW